MSDWHDRVEVYRNHGEVAKIVLDDATIDAWFARAEQGGEFRDVEVMALIRDLKDARNRAP